MAQAESVPLRQRARRPTPAELDAIPWLKLLDSGQRKQAVSALEVADAEPGERLCRIGRPATFWFGVVDGLLKVNNDDTAGQAITFTGIQPGGWFGEGTLRGPAATTSRRCGPASWPACRSTASMRCSTAASPSTASC